MAFVLETSEEGLWQCGRYILSDLQPVGTACACRLLFCLLLSKLCPHPQHFVCIRTSLLQLSSASEIQDWLIILPENKSHLAQSSLCTYRMCLFMLLSVSLCLCLCLCLCLSLSLSVCLSLPLSLSLSLYVSPCPFHCLSPCLSPLSPPPPPTSLSLSPLEVFPHHPASAISHVRTQSCVSYLVRTGFVPDAWRCKPVLVKPR